jgi:hypothetical protein
MAQPPTDSRVHHGSHPESGTLWQSNLLRPANRKRGPHCPYRVMRAWQSASLVFRFIVPTLPLEDEEEWHLVSSALCLQAHTVQHCP